MHIMQTCYLKMHIPKNANETAMIIKTQMVMKIEIVIKTESNKL